MLRKKWFHFHSRNLPWCCDICSNAICTFYLNSLRLLLLFPGLSVISESKMLVMSRCDYFFFFFWFVSKQIKYLFFIFHMRIGLTRPVKWMALGHITPWLFQAIAEFLPQQDILPASSRSCLLVGETEAIATPANWHHYSESPVFPVRVTVPLGRVV